MNIDELAPRLSGWLSGAGPESDVVISSRIRLARNLDNHPFLSTAGPDERTEIYELIARSLPQGKTTKSDTIFELSVAPQVDRQVLIERQLISRQHAEGSGSRGVSIAPNETHAVMINEEDHLRIHALRSGLEFEPLWEEVNAIDDALGTRLAYAFDRQLGYLTACPTNVGTGIRVSVLLHLPALKLTQEIERVFRAARDMKLAVRGLYGEGTEACGDLYQISNQVTLGVSEEEVITTFRERVIPEIAQYERTAREALLEGRRDQLDDKIWRAYAVLAHARALTGEEVLSLLSPIRMGIHLRRIDALSIQAVNQLFLLSQSAHLQKIIGRPLEGMERRVARAELIRARLRQPSDN